MHRPHQEQLSDDAANAATRCSVRELTAYFLRLGATGFGGPIALVSAMRRDLVDRRAWFSDAEYKEGLALAQLMPGPLAAQLAMYLGWARGGVAGSILTGIAFVLPSFAMVALLAEAYVRWEGLRGIQALFYGVGAAAIAVVARGAYKLATKCLGRQPLLWALFSASAILTIVTESEAAWVFIASGTAAAIVASWRSRRLRDFHSACIFFLAQSAATTESAPAVLLSAGGPSIRTLVDIACYFGEAGAFVFGSGLAIVPFLHQGLVERFHWLNERQFLDAVAVAMITPGPVVITVGFIGWLVAGPVGACVATAATFLPCWIFTVVPAPYYKRFGSRPPIRAFVEGVTAAAAGAIAGASVILARHSLVDVPTWGIAIVVLILLSSFRRLPEPLVILSAGAVGAWIHGWS